MNLGHKALSGSQGFKDLLGYLELANRARTGSLGSQDFQVVKGSKACQGCRDPQASQESGNQASLDPKVTGASGVFLGLWAQGGRKDQEALLDWGVPQESQACLESQVLWVLQVLSASLGPKEKVGLWGHRGHQDQRASQGFRASQGSQASWARQGPLA